MAGKVERTTELQQHWPNILDAVKQRRRFTWLLLSQNAQLASYDGSTVVLAFINQGAVDNWVSSNSVAVLEETLDALLGIRPTVRQIVDKQLPDSTSSRPLPTTLPVPSLPSQPPMARVGEESAEDGEVWRAH